MIRASQGLLSAAIAVAAHVVAGAAADVHPSAAWVTCVPGGVAAIPLERDDGTPWPSRVPVRIGGLESQAAVVWVGPGADDPARWWTRSPERISAMAAPGAPDGAAGAAFAMVELPASPVKEFEVCGAAVAARWLPAPAALRPDSPVLAVPATRSDDRPDPTTPSEHWRWALVAARQGAILGEARGGASDRLWGRHVACLWLGGLERIRLHSRGIHADLLDVLAGSCEDADHRRSVGAWATAPQELRALLAILVDPERTDADAAQAALTWMNTRWTCTLWVEEDFGERVRIAVANPTAGERVIRFQWTGTAGVSLPAAVVARPRAITRAWIDRPALQPGSDPFVVDRMRSESIEAVDGEVRTQLVVGAREYPARPPGLSFGTFMPPLGLSDAQARSIAPPPAEWRTSASLRRRGGRWELFIEAFRPEGAPGAAEDHVIVRLGDPEDPSHVFRVGASGSLEMQAGSDAGVAAGFMAWHDRWRARVELPEEWLPPSGTTARPLLVSVERVPGSARARQAAGVARPSWIPSAPPILVDLGAWDDYAR